MRGQRYVSRRPDKEQGNELLKKENLFPRKNFKEHLTLGISLGLLSEKH